MAMVGMFLLAKLRPAVAPCALLGPDRPTCTLPGRRTGVSLPRGLRTPTAVWEVLVTSAMNPIDARSRPAFVRAA